MLPNHVQGIENVEGLIDSPKAHLKQDYLT